MGAGSDVSSCVARGESACRGELEGFEGGGEGYGGGTPE